MKKTKISLMLMLMLVVVTISNTVFAVTASIVDTSKTGSVTITALSQLNGAADNTPIKGVEYSLYQVGSYTDGLLTTTVNTKEEAEAYIVGKTPVATKTTDDNGVASFTALTLGRYYAKVTAYPTGTSQIPESFLVDVPMTNDAGNGWVYDITVQPKVKVASGNAVLTKKDQENNPIQGVVFTVQVSTDNGTTWIDYVPEETGTTLTLTTDAAGQVKLEDYPITVGEKDAKFRLVETSVPAGYEKNIIDNSKLDCVYAQADGKTVVVHADGTQEPAAAVGELTMINEKPVVTKTVKNDDNDSYDEIASVSATDTISYNVTVSVPTNVANLKTFTLTDTLSNGLTGRSNIVITGMYGTDNATETIPTTAYTKTEVGQVLTLTFTPSDIKKYSAIIVTYDAKLDMDNAVIGSQGNDNTAELTYSNKIDVDGTQKSTTTTEDTAKVVTGGIQIHKVDSADVGLSGAKFKIATSKANAEAGTFVKGTDGQDIVAVSGADGLVEINGLAYNDDETARDYYLVETEAPTYVEDGNTKSYTLLSAPLKVAVSGTSHTTEIKVVNKKPISLPLTGGIGTALFAIAGVTLLVIGKSIKKEVKE
ncbi:MAG: SpaH/EbpB family LPXTG-anchored major pilin [Clostridia bacterium]